MTLREIFFHSSTIKCRMSKNQYEWLLFLAKMWRNTQQDDQDVTGPLMERIDGVIGKLTPSGRQPANESAFMRAPMDSREECLVNNAQGAAVKFNFLCKVFAFFPRNSAEKCKTRFAALFPANLDSMRVSALFTYPAQSSIPGTPPHVGHRPIIGALS